MNKAMDLFAATLLGALLCFALDQWVFSDEYTEAPVVAQELAAETQP